jgi:hypothetical protein
MLFLPQVGFFVEKGSYGLEIVLGTYCVKKACVYIRLYSEVQIGFWRVFL